MLASLPMYDFPDWPEVKAQTDAWWTGLAKAFYEQGIANAPQHLCRDQSISEWQRSDLLFSQCCGYDLMHEQAAHLRLIATPVYAVPDCEGSNYHSVIVVRAGHKAQCLAELRGGICAVNMPGSHSGYNVLRAMLAPLAQGQAFFAKVIETGSHRNSLHVVALGQADVCAVDAVSFALIKRYQPELVESLRVLERSPAAPALPYVTHISNAVETVRRLQRGLQAALVDPELAAVREALFIAGAERLTLAAYDRILELERQAYQQHYAYIH